jgi:hypothetical protein
MPGSVADRITAVRMKKLWGCLVLVVALAVISYGGIFALGWMRWGRGFIGSLEGRHAPERIRGASRVHIYAHVIDVEADRVVFRRGGWEEVSLPRGAPRELALRTYDVGGGKSGTRYTTSNETGFDVIDVTTGHVLVRLPWNGEKDARVWRDLIAEKIASRP